MGRFSGRSLEVIAYNTRIEPQGSLPRIGHDAFPFWQRITAKFVVSRCAFSCSINHLSGPLRKHMFTYDSCIRSTLFVSVFPGSLLVIALFRAIID